MRDFTGAFPDRRMREVWAVTTSQDNPIVRVQGFETDSPRVLDCPELNGRVYEGSYFDTFDAAKAYVVQSAQNTLKWATERVAKAEALEAPQEAHSVAL